MKSHERFIFDSYTFDPKTGYIELHYSLDDEVKFVETIQLPLHTKDTQRRVANLDRALFALHLIGGISYYKTCLPKTMEIRSGTLTSDEARFWNDVYKNGLGEFFFKNNIDFIGLINFPAGKKNSQNVTRNQEPGTPLCPSHVRDSTGQARNQKRLLVPIGGGKDSIVTAELLKEAGHDVTLLRMNAHPLIDEVAHIAELPLLTVDRHLSPDLFKLNAEGALNGHVPITAYLSFLAVIVAMLEGFDAVVMSNEQSASEGNVEFRGMQINHQWSKSLAFERSFQQYLRDTVGTDVQYFSLLRPWSELRIVQEFSKHPQYFHSFTSCNANWKIRKSERGTVMNPSDASGSWYGACPKCAFAFLLLSAFLPKEELLSIFGKNLFEDASLLPLYRELTGLQGFKPFECVGTPDESKTAFLLAHRRGDLENTDAMQMFLNEAAPSINNHEGLLAKVFAPSPEHAIPQTFQ